MIGIVFNNRIFTPFLVSWADIEAALAKTQLLFYHKERNFAKHAIIWLMEVSSRNKIIIKYNIAGMIMNLVMHMAGTESLGDALVSLSIIIAVVVYRLTGADIEHYLCIAISLLILYTGVRMIIETLTKILGARPDSGLKKNLIHLFKDLLAELEKDFPGMKIEIYTSLNA